MKNDNDYKNKNEFFKSAIKQFMLNKMNDLQKDKEIIESRSILRDIDEEDYYDMLVNKTRRDYAQYIFRQIRELIDMYL